HHIPGPGTETCPTISPAQARRPAPTISPAQAHDAGSRRRLPCSPHTTTKAARIERPSQIPISPTER
ncbi:MAG TPA: hypothetical protein PLQ35_14650, partial [bacterium]|nr:hypothetical protein [bacterium]